MSSRRRLFLIDANSQIFRAFYAIRGLSNSKGMPTNAVYGFTNMLRKLIREEEPDYLAAAFDPPGPTIRHEAFEEYKKSREEMPEELSTQIPWIKKVLEAFHVPILEIPSYEADDVIGTLAERTRGRELETIIVSEDKDLLQLVREDVKMLSERGERRLYDPEAVEEKYGIPPARIPDLLALIGDKIDDIPGVPGIGKVGARKLLQEYGSLEETIAHAEEISHKTYREGLIENADQARLSKELATVYTDLEVELDLDALEREDPDPERCRELFGELEFRSWLEEFTEDPEEADGEYRLIADADELRDAVDAARDAGRLAVDLLTSRPEPFRADLVGVALSWETGAGVYLPLGHDHLGADNAVDTERALRLLGPVLRDDGVEVVGHDLKSALVVLRRRGDDGLRPGLDTMVASYLLHPTRQSHALDDLTLDQLGAKLPSRDDLLPSKGAPVSEVPAEAARDHAARRADAALQLAAVFRPELESQGLASLYRDLEQPLIEVLADMELRGVGVDTGVLAEMSRSLGEELEGLRTRIHEAAGREFNLNSPQQLAEVLFDELGLESTVRTATGKRSTKAEVLEELAESHDVARWILEYRELAKLKSTYVDALPELVHPETGRIHASFNQAVAATGRLSSSNPNLQNIPVRTPLGREIRRAFVPAAGAVLMTADYSQIELRIMAHLAGDETLRRAFEEGQDVHRETASRIFDVDPGEVTSAQRDRAKVINFGIMYGMGPNRLAREFDISREDAQSFIDRYFETFSAVESFLDETVERARERGYVTTMLGRIRHLPELQSSKGGLRAFGERVAVNTPIQGTAADLIKVAMVRLFRRLREEGLEAAMIIQVHDELILEVPEGEVEPVTELVREVMESAIELDVPLEVDIGTGTNWLEAKG